jgi:hypothetical protein
MIEGLRSFGCEDHGFADKLRLGLLERAEDRGRTMLQSQRGRDARRSVVAQGRACWRGRVQPHG